MKHALLTLIGGWIIGTSTIAQVWTENFEGNWIASWSADNGSWDAGSPTSGPNAAHGGSGNCAATVLEGNYPTTTVTRWIRHVEFIVPPIEQNPRLTFWHWYSFSASDYGEIQVSTDEGDTWTSIAPDYTATGSGIWTRAAVDLRSWSDSTIRIAFFFRAIDFGGSVNGPDVSTGWYVDDVALDTGAYEMDTIFGFESGIGDWYAERGTWEIGVPTSGPGQAHTDSSCAATVLSGNYAPDLDSRLASPYFTVPVDGSQGVSFYSWHSFSTSDFGEVHVRVLGQPEWELLSNAQQYNSGGQSWSPSYFSLADYAGSTIQLGFFMHAFDYGGSVNGPDVSSGWYIDDVAFDFTTNLDETHHAVFTTWPNPFNDQVRIDLGARIIQQAEVMGTMGQSIRHLSTGSNSMIWDGLTTSGNEVPPGVYLVTVIADGQRYTQRVVKQ